MPLHFPASPDQDISVSLPVTQCLPSSSSPLLATRWVNSKSPGFAWLFTSGQAGLGAKGQAQKKALESCSEDGHPLSPHPSLYSVSDRRYINFFLHRH